MINETITISKEIFKNILDKLPRHKKRVIVAEIVDSYGKGGQTFVSKEFGVSRTTIRKGSHELRTGIEYQDAFNMRGRKKTTVLLPNLEQDLKSILDSQSQTDPSFKTTRLYTKITIAELRKQLVVTKKNIAMKNFQPIER